MMRKPPESEWALVSRLLAGDEDAFEEFFETYFPGLYRFALARVGGNEATAEDVVAAALSKAIDRLSTYRGEAALFSWLCTFCRHEISAHYRKNPPEKRVDLVEDIPEIRAALESLADFDGPEDALRRKEVARLVGVVLDSLPPRYGKALEWKYIEGLSVVEIAERLGMAPKAAESLLTRARQAFRDGFVAIESPSS